VFTFHDLGNFTSDDNVVDFIQMDFRIQMLPVLLQDSVPTTTTYVNVLL